MHEKVSPEDIRKLIETQGLECKNSLSLRKEGLQSLNAMVNADSATGHVLFGVAPDGTVSGIEPGKLDKAQCSLVQQIGDQFRPRIVAEMKILDCEGRLILVVRATRDPKVPLHEYDGRAFIREGSVSRQLELPEKLQIIRRRSRDQHVGPWRCDKCGMWVGEFRSFEFDGKCMKKRYDCECGGEFWPDT